jgi:hypothetical protein
MPKTNEYSQPQREGSLTTEQLLAACESDLEGLAIDHNEKLELMGAIQCIVESVLNRMYGLHE